MNSPCLTPAYLKSLSTGELIKLAEKYGLDISAGLDRGCIIEELLEYNKKNTENLPEREADDKSFGASVALPGQYNISFIDVNVRDPLWVFVFWEIKTQVRELHEKSADFDGYCIHVNPLADKGVPPADTLPFTVNVGSDDISRYLGFPPGNDRCFQVELRARHKNSFTVLAVSKPFILPVLIKDRGGTGVPSGRESEILKVFENPLAQLSGIDCYSLTRSVDRLPRTRNT